MTEVLGSILAAASPFLLLVVAGLGWLYRHEREKRRELESRLDSKKSEIYHSYIENASRIFVKETIKEQRDGVSQSKIFDVAKKNNELSRLLLIYGSKEVITAQAEYMEFMFRGGQKDEENPYALVHAHLSFIARLMTAMRRELGHSSPEVSVEEIGKLFITDYHSFKKS